MKTPVSRRGFAALSLAPAVGRVLGANDRIRVAIIGAGGRGSEHIRELSRLRASGIQITAICDVWRPNREKAVQAVKTAWGEEPRSTTNYKELLGWKEVDAVIIATPDFGHSRILEDSVKAGKDAYVEKPFATDFAEGKSAYLAVKKTDRVVQVGTQWRSDGTYIAAQKLIASGAIGQVTRAEFCANFQEPRWARDFNNVKAEDLDWKSFRLHRPEAPVDVRGFRQWQLFSDYTNGIAGLWMSHWANQVQWFLEDPYPANCVAHGGVYYWKDGRQTSDIFQALLDFPKGVFVSFEMGLTSATGIRNLWYGTRGLIDLNAQTISGEGSRRPDRLLETAKIKPEPTTSHMQDFLDCVRTRNKPRSDVAAGFAQAVAVCMAATSLETGRRIRFDRTRLEMVS